MRRVDLHATEAGVFRHAGRPGKSRRQVTDLVSRQLCTGQARDIDRAGPLWIADGGMRHGAGMAKLEPKLRVIDSSPLGKQREAVKLRTGAEHEVAGLFGEVGIALHLTDDRDGQTALGPALIEPDLGIGRIAAAIAKRIRHRRFADPVFQDGATWQLQRLEQRIAMMSVRVPHS